MVDRHGDAGPGVTGYRKHGCRCDDCKAAQREAMREYRNGRALVRTEHGSRRCYINGCRKPECVQANRDYQREYMRMRRSGIAWTDPLIEEALRA